MIILVSTQTHVKVKMEIQRTTSAFSGHPVEFHYIILVPLATSKARKNWMCMWSWTNVNTVEHANRTGSTSVFLKLFVGPIVKFRNWVNCSQIGPFLIKSPACLKVINLILAFLLVTTPLKSKFWKNGKAIPRDPPKDQVYKSSAKSTHFWNLQRAPKFLALCWS